MRARSHHLRRALGALALAATTFALARPGDADEPASFRLAYEAPAGCPTRENFAEALRFRTAKIVIDDRGTAGRGEIELVIRERRGKFVATLVLTVDGAKESRTMEGSRCETVAYAASLAAAILVDPAARTEAVPALTTPPVEAGAKDAEDEDASPDGGTHDAGPDAETSSPAVYPPPDSPPPSTSLHPTAAVAVGATTAIHGIDPTLGVRGGVEARRGNLRLWTARLGAFAGLASDVTSPIGTVRYQPLTARFDACPLVGRWGASLLDACVFGAVWLVPVSAPGAPVDHPQLRALFSPGLSARAGLPLGAGSSWALALDLSVGFHPAEERFRLEPRGEVFRLPRVYSSVGVEGSWTGP